MTAPPLETEVDGRDRALRRRVILIFADYTEVQSRMTVLRREVTLSRSASPGG
jgi:aminoglycoside phosphotransferase family enzyme